MSDRMSLRETVAAIRAASVGRCVWKFPLDELEMSWDLRHPFIRHVGEDLMGFHDQPCVWIERDDGDPTHCVTVRYCGTGHPIPPGEYVGTAVLKSSGLVWHVYATRVDL
jgi:hypothetical protein